MKHPALYLYDDAKARTFEPFALTRPVSALRAGTTVISARWAIALKASAAGSIVPDHLADFTETGATLATRGPIPAGAIIANSRFVPRLDTLSMRARRAAVWSNGGRIVALRSVRELPITVFTGGDATLEDLVGRSAEAAEVEGRWLDEVWHFLTTLGATLREDIERLGPTIARARIARGAVLGRHRVYVESGATIEPMVAFDTSGGPILVRRGATVRAFSRLSGPCFVGPHSVILADRVHGCSIGDACVIRGEISESIVVGQANKGHDGFVGQSMLGRWVNLGAGTITSNLKNTYGSVSLWTPGGVRDTGELKLGSLLGDHVKTGIGARLTTGTVVGAGSNVFGSATLPRYVPPFSWGESGALGEYRLDEFLRTMARALGRREVPLTDGMRRQLSAAHARARSARGS